jgi:hypothetical protein
MYLNQNLKIRSICSHVPKPHSQIGNKKDYKVCEKIWWRT